MWKKSVRNSLYNMFYMWCKWQHTDNFYNNMYFLQWYRRCICASFKYKNLFYV